MPSVQEEVAKFLKPLTPLPDDQLASFAAEVNRKEYPAGSFLTQIGDRHDRVGLVLRGLFRVYYLTPDGSLHIRNFSPEGRLVGSYATILSGSPAHVCIEATEYSTVLEFSFKSLAQRFAAHPAWERLGRLVAEQHYVSRERREYYLLTLDASARLARFREDFPGLEERLSRANIASYIGVKPETLSRIVRKSTQP